MEECRNYKGYAYVYIYVIVNPDHLCSRITFILILAVGAFISRWIAAQQKLPKETETALNGDVELGCSPSFRDPEKQIYGCEHYKRNCKLRAACCDQLFTCRFCHDKVSDHSMDR